MAFQRILSSRISFNVFKTELFCHKYLASAAMNNRTLSVEIDALDNFTSVLLQKRLDSLEMKSKRAVPKKNNLDEVKYDINFNNLNEERVNKMFSDALHECNDSAVIRLVQECIKYDICPNKDIIVQILQICAHKSEIGLINGIKNLCTSKQVHFCANFDFSLYEAHAIWMRGNVIKALEIFEKIYMNNPFLRRRIRLLLKNLISEGAKANSEAVLFQIVKFTENIVKKYKDYHPMMCVWEVCFLSQWYSDQQIALKLLNENEKLGEALIHRLPYILHISLKKKETEIIYRLLEILLDFQMREHYLTVIMTLLDYHFLQKNLRGYSEVIKWCKYKDLSLPNLYNEKYLQLLLNEEYEIFKLNTFKPKSYNYTFPFYWGVLF